MIGHWPQGIGRALAGRKVTASLGLLVFSPTFSLKMFSFKNPSFFHGTTESN